MTSGKVVIGIVIFIVIVIAIIYFMNISGFYDGAIFDYTMPTVFQYTDVPVGIIYENGLPIVNRFNVNDSELLKFTSEVSTLRNAESRYEAKRRIAEFKEKVAENDMKLAQNIKSIAEKELKSIRNAVEKKQEDINKLRKEVITATSTNNCCVKC
jgi:hypothetical protein